MSERNHTCTKELLAGIGIADLVFREGDSHACIEGLFGKLIEKRVLTSADLQDVLEYEMRSGDRFAGVVSNTGSGGTIASGDYLKQLYPGSKVVGSEALQCPTLLNNGFGGHRIEGIGDKHVPWIHNVRNTDVVTAIDDQATIDLIRLFNEPAGHAYLKQRGVPADIIANLNLMGISSVANVLAAIKMAKY